MTLQDFSLAEKMVAAGVWSKAYPDRRPWRDIGEIAQLEWLRVFKIYRENVPEQSEPAEPVLASLIERLELTAANYERVVKSLPYWWQRRVRKECCERAAAFRDAAKMARQCQGQAIVKTCTI